jgi:hypothetical protein
MVVIDNNDGIVLSIFAQQMQGWQQGLVSLDCFACTMFPQYSSHNIIAHIKTWNKFVLAFSEIGHF